MVSLDGDKLITFIPLYKNNYSKLMFCKHLNNEHIVSKSTFSISKVFNTFGYSTPLWYGFTKSIQRNIMFMSNSKVIFRCEIEDDTLNLLSHKGLFKMNSNYTTVNTT